MTSGELTTRPRRKVRRTVVVLGVAVLVVCLCWSWLATHEPPEIQRSRALRIGMTMSEANSVMGDSQVHITGANGKHTTLVFYYGRSRWEIMQWFNRVRGLLGLQGGGISTDDWPVKVHFRSGPSDLFVYRIERGDEVEEVPLE